MKRQYADTCQVTWPCELEHDDADMTRKNGPLQKPTCDLNLGLEDCPKLWTRGVRHAMPKLHSFHLDGSDQANDLCVPPPGSWGPCMAAVNFTSMSKEAVT